MIDRSDERSHGGMSMQTVEQAAGLKYYVRFDLRYVVQPINRPGAPMRPLARKSVRLDSPIIPITPEAAAKE